MANSTCRVDDCERPSRSSKVDLCRMHEYRLRYFGTLDLTGECVVCACAIPYKGKGRRQTLCSSDECRRAYDVRKSAEWRARNPAAANAARNAWRAANPDQHRATMRQNHLRREYGLTVKGYDMLLAVQGGGCAICGATKGNSRRARLAVDHDHQTGEVRGLLCYRCNTLIGNAKDDPEVLYAAISYLVVNGGKRPPRKLA